MSFLNPKCAIISAIAVGLYHTFPTRNDAGATLNTLLLASGTYVGLAWYDALYDCEDKSKASDWFKVYRPFKPPVGADGRYGGGGASG